VASVTTGAGAAASGVTNTVTNGLNATVTGAAAGAQAAAGSLAGTVTGVVSGTDNVVGTLSDGLTGTVTGAGSLAGSVTGTLGSTTGQLVSTVTGTVTTVLPGSQPSPGRAEEILAGYRTELAGKGFRFGVLTGELSVRPGAHGYQDAQATARGDLTGLPLAVAAGPVPMLVAGDGRTELNLSWATLTRSAAKLRFTGTTPGDPRPSQPGRLPYRMVFSQDRGEGSPDQVLAGLSMTDDLGRGYRLQPNGWRSGPREAGQPGRRYEGEILAEPEPEPEPGSEPDPGSSGPGAAASWLEFAAGAAPPARVPLIARPGVPTGPAEPPWPTPAECYLAELARATSTSIGTASGQVELDNARIVAAVADALLRTGTLPPGSALLSGEAAAGATGTAAGGSDGWRGHLKHQWGGHAYHRARVTEPVRAGLAVALPLRRATAVIETIAALDDYVSVQLYGHPWVSGEYWPMIAPCFQIRAVDDIGAGHEGVRSDGGGTPEASYSFWFWPPMAPEAKRIRVTVSTLWEAAWAELEIPGRS